MNMERSTMKRSTVPREKTALVCDAGGLGWKVDKLL